MRDFAHGVRHLTGVSLDQKQNSPYGDNWDIIWPGHCAENPPANLDNQYVIHNDDTVAPKNKTGQFAGLKNFPEKTRVIHRAGEPICTFAYAISYTGAQKVIAEVAMIGTPVSFDNDLAFMCRDRVHDVRCFTVEPTLFMHHRPAGSVSKDSDLAPTGDTVREKGSTESIIISTRLNIYKLLVGATDYILQW
jgi:hypothetical protein